MKFGYLMNSYPVTSTTFIRSEIQALESLQLPIRRYAVRRWNQALVDPRDVEEIAKTEYLLSGNLSRLVIYSLLELLTNFRGFVRAFGPWLSQFRLSSGSAVKHVAYLLEAIVLRRCTKRDGVGHLHVHFSTNSAAVAMLAKLLGGPSYSFTVHGPDEFLDLTSGSLQTKMQNAEFMVAISNYCRAQLVCLSNSGFWQKIHVVRCGVLLDDFEFEKEPAVSNQTLVCVGRLCVQKGQLLLPPVAAALRNEFPGLRLVLIGDGPTRQLLERSIAEYGVENMIELRGWQSGSAVRQALHEARALLLPTFAEGLPVVIMESLALGRPVISTYIAGIPELLDSGCGWIVPSGSEAHLREAMRDCLLASPSQLAMMRSTGRQRIEALHDVRRNAARLKELFLQVGTLELRVPPPVKRQLAGQPQQMDPVRSSQSAASSTPTQPKVS
jgi:glycosyltransferase involved in cell wall biosynthesis